MTSDAPTAEKEVETQPQYPLPVLIMFSVGTVVFLLVVVLHLASSANLRPHLVENGEKLGVTRNPDTVDELDVKAYLGLW